MSDSANAQQVVLDEAYEMLREVSALLAGWIATTAKEGVPLSSLPEPMRTRLGVEFPQALAHAYASVAALTDESEGDVLAPFQKSLDEINKLKDERDGEPRCGRCGGTRGDRREVTDDAYSRFSCPESFHG